MKALAHPAGKRGFAFVIAALVAVATMLAGNGTRVSYAALRANAQPDVLVRFVKAGPGPTQTVLEVDVGGASTETTALISSAHRPRRFLLGRPMLEALESRILAADVPQLQARYGSPNPGGVFTETTTGTTTTTVYPPVSGPAGLHRLNLYLEQILAEH